MSIKQFIYVDVNGDYIEGYADGNAIERSCDSGLAVGDLVCESSSIANGVDKISNNSDVRSVIGWVISKPDATTANILTKGVISGLSGLTKTGKVYLSTSGDFGSAMPSDGYLQILGHAIDADTIDFDPVNTKIKLFKPGFEFPLSYTSMTPASNTSYFGVTLDMDENTLVIGTKAGKFYVFAYDESSETWIQEAEISDPDGNDIYFGRYVKISGDTIITSSHRYDANNYTDNGRAYIYTRSGTTWTLNITIDGPNQDNSHFGIGLEIVGNIIVISAPEESINKDMGNGVIRIYEYNGTNVTLKQTINGNNAEHIGYNGIYIDGNRMIVSAGNYYDAWLYEYNGTSWVLSETFTGNEHFGHSVGISGDKIIIGAYTYDDGNIKPGAFYVYTYDGSNWNNSGPIMASDKVDGSYFGFAVSIYEDYVVIGAKYNDINGNSNVGKAYIYKFDGTNWIEKQIIEGIGTNDSLGCAVCVNDIHVIIGVYGEQEVRGYTNS